MIEKEWLNKIKWDENLNPAHFTFTYTDYGVEKELPYLRIQSMEGGYIDVLTNEGYSTIPMHRIRKIKEKGKIVFSRRDVND